MATKTGRGKLIPIVIILLVGLSFVGVTTYLSKILKTETYWVLNQDVPARTLITPDLLAEITTSDKTAPPTALTLADVEENTMFAQFPLKAGDTLTPSNVGGFEDISVGIPDNWVVTSFSVPSEDAVQGRIRRGTYFDMLAITKNGTFYPFINMLALETTINLSSASSADAVNTDEAHAGQTTVYTVGVPPEDAARLHDLLNNGYGDGDSSIKIKLILSPRSNEYEAPDIDAYTGMFHFNEEVGDSSDTMTKDASVAPENEYLPHTNNSFSHIKRDKFGRPIKGQVSCGEGNKVVLGDDCRDLNATKKPDKKKAKATSSPEPLASPDLNNEESTTEEGEN